jgi:hypothetical protein
MYRNIILPIVILVLLIIFGGLIYYIYSKDNSPIICKKEKCKNTGKIQVYNIKGNLNYDEANSACKAECGQLASLNQMIDAQKKGAEWCNQSWSADQLVLYPSQGKGNCGNGSLPGINGGRMHKNANYGANCYGPKPQNRYFKPTCPPSYKRPSCKIPISSISPFNKERWSEF